jgi:hypothetical protein
MRLLLVLVIMACGSPPPPATVADPLDPKSVDSVLRHMRAPPGEDLHELARAVVRARDYVHAFAVEHGWEAHAAVRTFDAVEIFRDHAEIFPRILAINDLPPETPSPTATIAAALEGRILLAVVPSEYQRQQPVYAAQQDAWARLLAHEMVHRLHPIILGGNEEAMGQPWFFEGFACLGAGQDFDADLTFASSAEALAAARDVRSPLAYRRFLAAVRYFAGQVPLAMLVARAGSDDFEAWLSTLP